MGRGDCCNSLIIKSRMEMEPQMKTEMKIKQKCMLHKTIAVNSLVI